MIETYLDEFNEYVREFGSRTFLVAGRIFDLDTKNWEFLACAWYEKNGLLELPGDKYLGKLPNGMDAWRYHSVDNLVLKSPTELVGVGKHIFDGWKAEKARIIKRRNADPVVVITPPPPEPPKPKPVPIELPPKKEEPKKKPPRAEWVVKLSTYLTILTPVVAVISYFLPPPFNAFAGLVIQILKALIGG